MYTEEEVISITDINSAIKTISIAKDTIVMKDGVQIAKSRHRCAFVPGDIEKVKEYTGWTDCPELDYLNAIWTPEVIAAHQAIVAEAEAELQNN